MTSRITKTDGSLLTTIADGTVDNTTNLILIGKNYAGYGDFLNENFIHILENAASSTAPENPLEGQLWWDKGLSTLKVWTGSIFKVISSSTSQDTAPDTPVIGDLWWDTFNGQLNVYNGTAWTLIGPAFTTSIGTSGTIVDSITDDNGDAHIAIKVFIEETLVAVISKDSIYTVDSVVESGIVNAFSTIGPGFNLASRSEVSDISFYGTATDATTFANVAASNYARTDLAHGTETFYNPVTISNNTGLTIGPNSTYSQTISGNTVVLKNNVADASSNPLVIRANIPSVGLTDVLVVGSNAEVRLSVSPNVANGSISSGLAVATVENVRTQTGNVLLQDASRNINGVLKPNVTDYYDLGSTSNKFKTFYTSNVTASLVNAATVGNTGATIIGSSVSAATIGNAGAALTSNTLVANTATINGNLTVANAWLIAPYANVSTAIYAGGYYFANGSPFIPGVATVNSQLGAVSITGSAGVTVNTTTGTVSITQSSGYNGYGVRTVSSSAPSGGSNGDVWYQV